MDSKKLTLSKETLRTLNDDELTDVAGGASGICVNTVVCNSGVCHSAVCDINVGGSIVCASVVC